MRGDTIVAQFTPPTPPGEARRAEPDRGAAEAQSYHLDANTKTPRRPSINYSRGDAITVTMKAPAAGGVDRVDIRGKVDGIQLEAGIRLARAGSTPRGAQGRPPMSTPDWIATLGDRDPSVPIALAAITRAAGAEPRSHSASW